MRASAAANRLDHHRDRARGGGCDSGVTGVLRDHERLRRLETRKRPAPARARAEEIGNARSSASGPTSTGRYDVPRRSRPPWDLALSRCRSPSQFSVRFSLGHEGAELSLIARRDSTHGQTIALANCCRRGST